MPRWPSVGDVNSVRGRLAVRPSPVFLGIVAAFALLAVLAWRAGPEPSQSDRVILFGFVLTGWVISLCLHEFGHAVLAYYSGDRSVAVKGYLTLNPARYANVALSIVLPLLFVLLGGIGLPGGAVYIERGAIPGRIRHSLVSAAGPAMNVVFALTLIAIIPRSGAYAAHLLFWSAFSYLAFLQVTAVILNLLPIPGLDGFTIWEPWLPPNVVRQAAQVGGYGFMALLLLLWWGPANRAFFNLVYHVTSAVGLNSFLIGFGEALFRFWAHHG